MIKRKIIIVFLLSMIACKEKKTDCKSIENLNFPKDINIMFNSKQVCDSSSNKWGAVFKLEYDDYNFALLGYNEKIKILIDKKNDLIMCIKSNEVNNFDIIYNDNDKFTYGINEIIFLDNDLMPTYSIGNYGAYKYFNDKENHQTKYCLINTDKIQFESLDYNKILKVYEKITNLKIDNAKCEISPYYKNPYSWEL
ncbi:hypothetical protein DRF59_01750 [Chryseobacterium flavum]|uniref:Lipoprotein n=1 Tax=Chryseobacterium flavum TaxID=415851 RepID=A0A3D9CV08_9FLAO|nr:hypothetical protein [Chryseobacterium flavum]REC69610.1 hypothetical protein DRF59_01750 [Chryseobacterium flavum]